MERAPPFSVAQAFELLLTACAFGQPDRKGASPWASWLGHRESRAEGETCTLVCVGAWLITAEEEERGNESGRESRAGSNAEELIVQGVSGVTEHGQGWLEGVAKEEGKAGERDDDDDGDPHEEEAWETERCDANESQLQK